MAQYEFRFCRKGGMGDLFFPSACFCNKFGLGHFGADLEARFFCLYNATKILSTTQNFQFVSRKKMFVHTHIKKKNDAIHIHQICN